MELRLPKLPESLDLPTLIRKLNLWGGGLPGSTGPGRLQSDLGIFNVLDYGAKGNGIADDTTAIQRAIAAASAAGGGTVYIPYFSTPYISGALIGASNVTLMGIGGRPTLKTKTGSNATLITGTSLTNFHVVNIEIDGNKSNQSGSGLADTPVATVGPRGIYLDTCTSSSVRDCYVHDCRFHGVLVNLGSDNWVENLVASANGSLANTCYGNGLYIASSPRFSGQHIIASSNDANSGVSTVGATACADVSLSDVVAIGNGASNITLNSLRPRLENFYAASSTTQHGLNIGHDTSADLHCDDAVVIGGRCEANATSGMNLAGALGATVVGVTCYNNVQHNIAITGIRSGNHRFLGCVADTTTSAAADPAGVGILLTASGAGTPIGNVQFVGCTAKSSTRVGVKIAGVSRERRHGGTLVDNVGAGLITEDTGGVGADDILVEGVEALDTRAGGSRTQTVPIQTAGAGDRCRCLGFTSRNHVTNDNPQMGGGSNNFFFGAPGGSSFLGWGSTGSSGTLTRSGNMTAGIVDAQGLRANIVAKTTGYNITTTDFAILSDATSGGMTHTLPTAATAPQQFVAVIKTDSTVNTVTVDGASAETVDGATTVVLRRQWQGVLLQCDGTAWYVVAAIGGAPSRIDGELCLGSLLGANMNSTSDQSITISSANYLITAIIVTNASVSLTTAAGGVYTAASKGGTAVVAAGQVYSALTAATKQLALTLNDTDRRTANPLYLSLTTGQGSAATADVYIFGRPLD